MYRVTAFAAVLMALLWTSAAPAQTVVYRAVNLGPADRLDVRATPNPNGAIVARLSPGVRHLDVIETRDGWGRILLRNAGGWVDLAHLAAEPRTPIPGQSAPGGFHCAGTEPFWGLEIGRDGTGHYNDLSTLGDERALTVTASQSASGREQPFVFRFDGEVGGTAIISRQSCSDGMSDRVYGWQAYIEAMDADGWRFVEGCCRVPLQE